MRVRLIGLLLAWVVSSHAAAAEVAGVQLPESMRAGPAQLVLNGAGLRTRVFFKVYAMGLYLPERRKQAAEAIALPGAKRVAIHMLRTVDAETFTTALVDGLRDNHDEAQFKRYTPSVAKLNAIMASLKEAKEGMRIFLDWVPGTGVQVIVDDRAVGQAIADEDFYRGLLRIWLGENPVQSDLKKALLGERD